jgi:hypothetical protein
LRRIKKTRWVLLGNHHYYKVAAFELSMGLGHNTLNSFDKAC